MKHSMLTASAAAACAGLLATLPNLASATGTAEPVVPDALAQESFSLNLLSNTVVRNGIGTLNYDLNPGCAMPGACFATAALNGAGGGPSVYVDINQPTFAGAGGGDNNYAEEYFYVEYHGTGPVTIEMSDTLTTTTPSARAQAYFGFGVANPSFNTGLSADYGVNFVGDDGSVYGQPVYALSACAGSSGCISGGSNTPQLGNIYNANMTPGVVYLVDIWTEVAPANGAASALLDPTFYSPNGTFTYSAGINSITAAVPEGSTWAMMLIGLCWLGVMTYRRRSGAMLAA